MNTTSWILLGVAAIALTVGLVGMFREAHDLLVLTNLAVCVVSLLAGAICAAIQDSREWEAFAAEHACVKVGHMSGSTFNTVGINSSGGVSVGVGSTPDKTGYRCNDGMTYWR